MGTTAKGRAAAGPARKRPGWREEVAGVVARLLGGCPDVTPGKMFGYPAFYVGGKLCACVVEEGVGIKLPAAQVQALEGRPGCWPFRPYGKPPMREWIEIRRTRAEAYAGDAALFEAAVAFVRGAGRVRKTSAVSRQSAPTAGTGSGTRRPRRHPPV